MAMPTTAVHLIERFNLQLAFGVHGPSPLLWRCAPLMCADYAGRLAYFAVIQITQAFADGPSPPARVNWRTQAPPQTVRSIAVLPASKPECERSKARPALLSLSVSGDVGEYLILVLLKN